MDDILAVLSRLFQWTVIYAFFVALGSGFVWIVTLGRYPDKKSYSSHWDYLAILGVFVLIALLWLSYGIWRLVVL
ncbi:MAG: hypothetical protein ACQESH_07525 [Campylobacterota bacterium]